MSNPQTSVERVQGVVTHIIWPLPEDRSNAKSTIGVVTTNNDARITFKANMVLLEAQPVILHGSFINDPNYGKQFLVKFFELDLKPSELGLKLYLEKNPLFKGIGKVKSELIARNFHKDFERILFEEPNLIREKAKLTSQQIYILQTEWKNNLQNNAIKTKLLAWNLTPNQVDILLDQEGVSIVSRIELNPYCLIDLVDGYGFKKCDTIAIAMEIKKDDPRRVKACIKYCLDDMLSNGSTWGKFDDVVVRTRTELNLELTTMHPDSNPSKIIMEQIRVLIEEKKLAFERINDGLLVLSPIYLHKQEMEIVERFNLGLTHTDNTEYLTMLSHFADNLNDKQKQSVMNAISWNISILTGLAGTGKTFTIRTIADIFDYFGASIAIAAPTGKAAQRIQESTTYPASTIHRLLEYNPGKGFQRNIANKLTESVIILDECSMIDVELFYHLLEAIDFCKTRLILTGDPAQLPPVGKGNILRDLIDAKTLPTVQLTEVIRNAGDLQKNSKAILDRQVNPTTQEISSKYPGLKSWILIEHFTKEDQLKILNLLEDTFLRRLDKYGIDLINDVQLIVPMKDGITGTKELNIMLQKLLQKKLYNFDVPEAKVLKRKEKGVEKEYKKTTIYANDKVIQIKNDYKLGVFNGQVGRVLEISKQYITIEFGTKMNSNIVEIPNREDKINNLQLAYALTVHKVQGSEWPCVIALIGYPYKFMLNRNLFYTAATRASQSLIIIGDRDSIRYAAWKDGKESRNTFAKYYLRDMEYNLANRIQ